MPSLTRIPEPAGKVDELSYDSFLSAFKLKEDQHVTICGPTGCGKSVLIIDAIVPQLEYLVYLSTKPRDATLEDSELAGEDYGWTDEPKDIHPWVHKKWVVGLKGFSDPESVKDLHRNLFRRTINQLFASSGWAIIADEGRYICDSSYLNLYSLIAQWYIQGRSDFKRVTLATQRPSWVPPEAFDQAVHLFFFNDEDRKNVERMAEAAGANRRQFLDTIPHLETTEDDGGQFLYYNRLTKRRIISKVEL